MSNPLPSIPPGPPAVAIPVDQSSSLWERISTWVSENKAVVYTIAGVAVVFTGAGVVYYLNTPVSCLRSTSCLVCLAFREQDLPIQVWVV
jgi:hypothetical protein